MNDTFNIFLDSFKLAYEFLDSIHFFQIFFVVLGTSVFLSTLKLLFGSISFSSFKKSDEDSSEEHSTYLNGDKYDG